MTEFKVERMYCTECKFTKKEREYQRFPCWREDCFVACDNYYNYYLNSNDKSEREDL